MKGVIILGNFLFLAMAIGLVALIVAYLLDLAISRASAGNARMQEIAGYISEGSMAFLNREYKYLFVFVAVVAAIIAVFIGFNII